MSDQAGGVNLAFAKLTGRENYNDWKFGAPSDIASSSTEVSDNSPDVSLENEMFTELPSNRGRMDNSSISASGIQESSDDPESDQPTDSHAIDLSFDDLRISSRGRVIKPKKFPGYDLYFTAERSCPST
ncbi:hypothetical protein JTB14_011395 [Gonioctena quinquepunctata]|nr:hypothetical protein JTB14_011395 [Gonioctena quinquepunctata]